MKTKFTSESVTEGHPDKVCDIISDSILDAILVQDKEARVAMETFVKSNKVYLGGEITTSAKIDFEKIVKDVLLEIGYDYHPQITKEITMQSLDIARGITGKNYGAGDQGLMFGYATDETKELMPLPISLAHKLCKRLSEVRKNKTIDYLLPDGKSQVTVEYDDGVPKRVDKVVISAQHKDVDMDILERDIKQLVIDPVIGNLADKDTKYLINATGKFLIGGPIADAGLTGRKIIADTYGGAARHGGGCFSGKDPTKVDRSAAYFARYVAKNIVASGLAKRCEIQVAYCIGIADPVSIHVTTFGTGDDKKIEKIIKENFSFRPKDIIEHLDLKRPIYKNTSAYGHFGRDGFTWEKIDKKF